MQILANVTLLTLDLCFICAENESGRSTTSSNTTVGEEGGDDFPLPPTCSNLRVMGDASEHLTS